MDEKTITQSIAKSLEELAKKHIVDYQQDTETVRSVFEKAIQDVTADVDVEVICDEFNNSDEDHANRRINSTVIFWPKIATIR
jgi:hypothetical protein